MTDVIILAAGFGTRLNKAGLKIPKGLIPHNNSTILGQMLKDLLMTNTFENIGIVSNDMFFDQYKKWIDQNGLSKKIKLLNDDVKYSEERLGAIGDLIFAIKKLKVKNDLLVLPSDTLYKFSIKSFVDFSKKHTGFCTAFRQVKNKNTIKGRYGCAEIKADKIMSFEEKPRKPKGNFLAIPFYYYPKQLVPRLFEYKKEGGNLDAPGSIITWFLQENTPVFSFITNKNTLDVGTPKELKQVENNEFS